jgi:hypothetical protein
MGDKPLVEDQHNQLKGAAVVTGLSILGLAGLATALNSRNGNR